MDQGIVRDDLGVVLNELIGDSGHRSGEPDGRDQHHPSAPKRRRWHQAPGGASLRSTLATPFTRRTALSTLARCGRLSTSTKTVPKAPPSLVCRSAPRILVPV